MESVVSAKADAARALLRRIASDFAPAAFANSLGAEDMVLTDMILAAKLPIEIFTLDTGRLPQETYALLDALAERYGTRPRIVFPQAEAVEAYVAEHGANAFYRSLELRKACCQIRKVEPLARALAGKRAWITGLRRGQAITRGALAVESYDAAHQLAKFNPLADWSHEEVWSYIRAHQLPYNPLHDRGYSSIGCAPCTRALAPGEDIRAGRWWWENPASKECGLHLNPETGLVRVRAPA
jgi:phosphoadenosine phosphosulfate reductase